jgi:hypothetical protein
MVVRKLSTGALSLLLAGAGTLQVAASAQRWWPACRFGDFETAACLRLQSHTYDFVVPSAPWVPVGHASVLAGLSLLLLGLGVTGLPLLLRPGRRPALAWLLCAVLGLSQLLAGVSTVASGLLGRPVGEPGTPFVAFVWLGWPVALTLTSILMVGRVRRPAAGWLLLIVLLTASTPLAELFMAPIVTGYVSYDTTPWSEGWGGACLLLASLAVWPAAYRPRRRPTPATATAPATRPASGATLAVRP